MKAIFQNINVTSYNIVSTWKRKQNQKSCEAATQTKNSEDEFTDNSTQYGLKTEIIQAIVDDKGSNVADIVSKLTKTSKQVCNQAIINGCLIVDDYNVITDPDHVCEPKSYIELTIGKHDAYVSNRFFLLLIDFSLKISHACYIVCISVANRFTRIVSR